MAAGSGSRYGKLKQFDTFGPHGEFLMEYSIYDAIYCGFQQIVIVTREERIPFLEEHFNAKLPSGISLTIVPQLIQDIPMASNLWKVREKPWGTAHAIWAARKEINTSFVVINADDFYGRDAFKKAAYFLRENPEETTFGLVSYPLLNTLSQNGAVSRGICSITQNQLSSIREVERIAQQQDIIIDLDTQEPFSGEELVSMNFWVCKPLLFREIESYFLEFLQSKDALQLEAYIPSVIQELIKWKKINVKNMITTSQWFGITYKEDRDIARSHIQDLSSQNKYPQPLW